MMYKSLEDFEEQNPDCIKLIELQNTNRNILYVDTKTDIYYTLYSSTTAAGEPLSIQTQSWNSNQNNGVDMWCSRRRNWSIVFICE